MGKARIMGMVALVVAAALLSACKSDGASVTKPSTWFGEGESEPVAIHNQWQGSDAAFSTPGAVLIDSAAKLQEHGNTQLSNLNVDFSSQSIVVFSLGEQPTGGYWAWITGVQKSGDKLWVQATVNRPAAGATTTQGITHPIAAAVIDRQDGITQVYTDSNPVEGQELPSATASPAAAPAPASGTMEPMSTPAGK